MKKIFLTMILTMLFVGLYNFSVYAEEYHNTFYAVYEPNSVMKVSLSCNTNTAKCVMILLDNGSMQRYIPLFYSDSLDYFAIYDTGNTNEPGTTLDQAKKLKDFYVNEEEIMQFEYIESLGKYVHQSWKWSSRYYDPMVFTEFELGATNIPQVYYKEEGGRFDKNMITNALKAYFNNDLGNFTIAGGNISKVSNYTLEPPLNIQVSNNDQKNIVITWEQSEGIDVTGWYTEFYFQQTGTYKKALFSSKKKFDTDFIFFNKILNHYQKFKFNALNIKNTEKYLEVLCPPYPQVTTVEKTNIMIRNVYDDGNGNVYYSNYVYLYQDENYEYIANEVDGDGLDKNGMTSTNIDSNIKTDSDIYDNSNIHDISSGMTSGNAVGLMRSLLQNVKEFPQFVYEFFSFIPSEVFLALSALLLLLIPLTLIKMVV